MGKRRKQAKPIAVMDSTISIEPGLPRPFVHYPPLYGLFHAFSAGESDTPALCACARPAFEMWWGMETDELTRRKALPAALHTPLLHGGGAPVFADAACHGCNYQTPAYAYCHSMYGGTFKQNYGWYIEQEALARGIYLTPFILDPNAFDTEMATGLPMPAADLVHRFKAQPLSDDSELRTITLAEQDIIRRVTNNVESAARVRFGFKPVGEAWTSETLLYKLIREAFPGIIVEHHYRADWLERLELDVYLPDFKVGVEYQGVQHFEPMPHWGGEKALSATQARDKKKQHICKKLGVRLIYFFHDEVLTRESVVERLSPYIQRTVVDEMHSREASFNSSRQNEN